MTWRARIRRRVSFANPGIEKTLNEMVMRSRLSCTGNIPADRSSAVHLRALSIFIDACLRSKVCLAAPGKPGFRGGKENLLVN